MSDWTVELYDSGITLLLQPNVIIRFATIMIDDHGSLLVLFERGVFVVPEHLLEQTA